VRKVCATDRDLPPLRAREICAQFRNSSIPSLFSKSLHDINALTVIKSRWTAERHTSPVGFGFVQPHSEQAVAPLRSTSVDATAKMLGIWDWKMAITGIVGAGRGRTRTADACRLLQAVNARMR
jgi:hypothetical protein